MAFKLGDRVKVHPKNSDWFNVDETYHGTITGFDDGLIVVFLTEQIEVEGEWGAEFCFQETSLEIDE